MTDNFVHGPELCAVSGKSNLTKKLMLASSASLMVLLSAQAAQAQTADPEQATDNRGLAEIVVTAQKRAESLSKTAAAVSVIGQATLDNTGARTFTDAVSTLPSVSASGLGGTIAIRGLGTNTLGAGNGTVAFHIDGIFQSSGPQSNPNLYDIARVEVLRGPQGTLYGRNATAGVVNVITNNANTEAFEAFGDVSYGSWNNLMVRGAVNVPVTDDFALRLTGVYEKSDDWMKLTNGDHPPLKDNLNLRLAWRAKPSDSITWDARVTYIRQESRTPVTVPTYQYNETTKAFDRASNPRNIAELPPGTDKDGLAFLGIPTGVIGSAYKGVNFEDANTQPQRFIDFRSNLNFELSDALSLTYLLGYAHSRQLVPTVIAGLLPYQVRYSVPRNVNIWSHEANLNYTSERLKAILGVYSYQSTTGATDQFTRLIKPNIDPATREIIYDTPLIEVGEVSNGPTKTKTRAVFGQATFDVTDRFRITGGARYNWDKVSFADSIKSQCPFGSGVDATNPNAATLGPIFAAALGMPALASLPLCTAGQIGIFAAFDPTFAPGFFYTNRLVPGGSKNFEKFSWKATAEYDVAPDTMVYATVATGYKAGGVGDSNAVGDARFFRPETNINYEAGIRSKLFDNTLSLNLTAFWTDYKDLQIQSTTPNLPGQLISINAGKSRSRGVELEYVWAPTPADRINGYVAYLDAKFRDFPGKDTLTGEEKNFAGNRLPGAPEFSARASYSHIFDLGSAGTITPTASIVYQTKTYVAFTNNLPSRVPAYTRSDLIIRYETEGKNFSVEGYVNNIEDKQVVSSMFPEFGVSNVYYNPPRSYGVRVGFRY